MFWAVHRSSSGALTVFAASGLHFPLRLDYGRSPHAYVNQRLQIQLELLILSGVLLKTCWAFNERWNNKFYYKVASCWLFLLNHTAMDRSINIKLLWTYQQMLYPNELVHSIAKPSWVRCSRIFYSVCKRCESFKATCFSNTLCSASIFEVLTVVFIEIILVDMKSGKSLSTFFEEHAASIFQQDVGTQSTKLPCVTSQKTTDFLYHMQWLRGFWALPVIRYWEWRTFSAWIHLCPQMKKWRCCNWLGQTERAVNRWTNDWQSVSEVGLLAPVTITMAAPNIIHELEKNYYHLLNFLSFGSVT